MPRQRRQRCLPIWIIQPRPPPHNHRPASFTVLHGLPAVLASTHPLREKSTHRWPRRLTDASSLTSVVSFKTKPDQRDSLAVPLLRLVLPAAVRPEVLLGVPPDQ